MSTVLRYLHLSDFHFSAGDMTGTDWTAERLKQDTVNSSLLAFLAQELEGKPLDFIIISGDIAYGGKREEYAVAAKFFQRLAEMTQVPAKRFYPVAGNHDVNRASVTRMHRKLYRFDDQDDIADILADRDFFPQILRKFGEFNDFAETIMGRRHYSDTIYHLTEVLDLDKGGKPLKINLLGLNSALFAGFDGDEEQGLALGLVQVDKALAQMAEEAQLSIGFFHHPFSSLHPEDEVCGNRLKHKLDLILHGHVHQASSAAEHSGAGAAVLLGAGAAYESRSSRNGFNLVEIDLSSGAGMASFFKYLPQYHCWNRDNDVCPHESDGVFKFQVKALQGVVAAEKRPESFSKPTSAEPMSVHLIHDYLLPADFTGRDVERQDLKDFLHGNSERQSSVTAICALGGMGKSCLARRVLEDLNRPETDTDNPQRGAVAPYQAAVWFSFYEARTEDEAYAFREILSRLSPAGADAPAEKEGAALSKHLRNQLCRYLDKQAVLLVLDGLEVIQHSDDPQSPHYGQIEDNYKETLQLIRHCCNQIRSRMLITTRVSLSNLEGAARYEELLLPVLSLEEAAAYLAKLGVSGDSKDLRHCAELFGGHPLCLRAAGKQMQRRRIPATEVEALVGNPDLFKRSSEGERVAKIVDTHRAELSEEQEYFLQMLSIHPRSVTQRHFSALVQGFAEAERDARWVQDDIIYPLETRGLIEVLLGAKLGEEAYNAHPLMKLAFANWLNPADKHKAHEQWAKAAKASPVLTGWPSNANSLEALQPWLDVIEHYLEARDWAAAWEIYRGRGVDNRLMELAYFQRLRALGLRFEQALMQGWELAAGQQIFLYEYLGQACGGLSLQEEDLTYRKKQFAAAEASGNADNIVVDGAILAESHAGLGHIKPAKEVLAQIQAQAEALSSGVAKHIYQSAQAKTALFAGDYTQAIALYEAVVKDEDDTHNDILFRYFLGETQTRAALLPAAEQSLHIALQAAEQQHITRLIPEILQRLTWLALKQNQLNKARTYNDRRTALKKSLDLPGQGDDGFLLISEGAYAQALSQAQAELERIRAEGLDKANEIHKLLILSQAQHGLGDSPAAKESCQQARDLMTETGCWQCKDWLAETEALFD